MALYRQDATGFLCEFASNPGAGYTAVAAQPTDTLANRVTWWRARDVDAALGQASVWHPSLQSGNAEIALPPGLAGRGTNVVPYLYTSFEGASLPPLAHTNMSAAQVTGGYHGGKCLRLTTLSNPGTTYFNASAAAYNIKLTANRRWLVSVYAAPITAQARTFTLLLKTAGGTTHEIPLTSGAVANTFTRLSGVADLSADASAKAVLGVRIDGTSVALLFDGVMIEERIGDGTAPSAFVQPFPTIDGSILDDGTVPSAKIASLVADKITSGTLNAVNVNVTNLNAANVTTGTFNGARFGTDTIGSGPVIFGALHSQQGGLNGSVNIPYNTNSAIQSSSYWTAPLTLPANANRTSVLILVLLQSMQGCTQAGRLTVGAARNSTSAGIMSSCMHWCERYVNTFIDTVTYLHYDSAPGTGVVNYYAGFHHSVRDPSSVLNCQYRWCILEFSK